MIVKLLTERHLEFLSLKGGCTGSSESTLVKMSNCWKSHALACPATGMQSDDEALLNIMSATQGPLVGMLITLEPHGMFRLIHREYQVSVF